MVVWSPKAQLFPGETRLFGLINKLKAESVGGWRGGVCVGGGLLQTDAVGTKETTLVLA